MKSSVSRPSFLGLLLISLLVSATLAAASGPAVELRSGVIEPGHRAAPTQAEGSSGPERWVVRFKKAPGQADKNRLIGTGARVETPLPGQAYLVTTPAGRGLSLKSVAGVDWATPYLPQDKIAPEIAAVRAAQDESNEEEVIVLLHLFADANAATVAAELTAAGLQVDGSGGGARFGRVVLRMKASELASRKLELASRNDVFWVERRHRRTLQNNNSIWIGQSGLYAGEATPVFAAGIYGEGQIGAVLDTGIDADMCYFRDDALGLPPTDGTIDSNQRKVIGVTFLDPAENPADPTHWDTQNHGTHVAGIFAGDDLATPILHDLNDGMAPGAKLFIQDAGFAADACGDLPGIGCPVTDLNPIFQEAYDKGARVHSNSWNDNENAQVQNNYTDASQDVDEFMWNNPDFLVVFACGNQVFGGTGTMGSPGTAKNGVTVCGTFGDTSAEYMSDISAWGPTDDGRIKPDVVFPSSSIDAAGNDFSVATNNCEARRMGGTSMAAPGVAGNALLVREYFMDGFYPTGAENPGDGFTPSASLLRAMVVNSAVSIIGDTEGNPITIPSDPQGWGRVLLDNALHFAGQNRKLWIDDVSGGFSSPSDPPVVYMLEVTDASEPLEVTLAWTDYPSTPAASVHLVNDLDLRVDGASGSYHGNWFLHGQSLDQGQPDRLNNLEQVLIEVPEPGVYAIEVSAHAVPAGPQGYSLVVTGGGLTVTAGPRPAYLSHVIDDSGPNGNGDGVLDPGETARIPVNLRNSGDASATSVIGDMYSASPGYLTINDATAPYADMVVGAQAASASPHYEVTMQPSASCGMSFSSSINVHGNGFDVNTAFTLDAGLRYEDLPSVDTPLEIPKSSTSGVWSFLTVPEDFQYTEVDVTVNIDHDDIGEFKMFLYTPINTALTLHNKTQQGVSGLHTTYDELTPPHGPGTMDDFLGLGPSGSWRLRIIDDVGGGTQAGTLQNWTLHFKSDVPFNCNPVSCGESVPPAVGNTLHVEPSGASDVQVTWNGVGGASNYNVWRSADSRQTTAAKVGTTGGTAMTDSGARNLPGLHFYTVRSVNTCNWESP